MRAKVVSSNDIYFSCLFPEDDVIEGRVPRPVIMHVISGKMEIDDHEQRIEANAGQTVFVRRDHQVRIHKGGNDGESYSAVSIIFDRSFLREYFNNNVKRQELPEQYAHLYKSAIILPEDSEVRRLLISLQGYIGAEELPNPDRAIEIKTEVIDALLRENPELYPVLFDFNEPWKIDILEFMERNFTADFTLDELASYTGRSRAGFKRDFAKISPLTPQKWLIRHRLEAALKMIVNEKMPVGEACLKSGFKNRTHFIKVFKQLFGVAPSEATEETLYRNV